MQLLLHGGHQAFGMPLGILDLEVLELFGAIDTGALERELQQIEFFAPFGNGEGHSVEKLWKCRRTEYLQPTSTVRSSSTHWVNFLKVPVPTS